MKPHQRDLRGATVKLANGETFTIPEYWKRPLHVYGSAFYHGEHDQRCKEYSVCDCEHSPPVFFAQVKDITLPYVIRIHRVLKFPNRKLAAGRDLRGAKVQLVDDQIINIPRNIERKVYTENIVFYDEVNIFDDTCEHRIPTFDEIHRIIRRG